MCDAAEDMGRHNDNRLVCNGMQAMNGDHATHAGVLPGLKTHKSPRMI